MEYNCFRVAESPGKSKVFVPVHRLPMENATHEDWTVGALDK